MFTETLYPPPKHFLLFHISFASALHRNNSDDPCAKLVNDRVLAWLRRLGWVCQAIIAQINTSILCANPPDQSTDWYIKSQWNVKYSHARSDLILSVQTAVPSPQNTVLFKRHVHWCRYCFCFLPLFLIGSVSDYSCERRSKFICIARFRNKAIQSASHGYWSKDENKIHFMMQFLFEGNAKQRLEYLAKVHP